MRETERERVVGVGERERERTGFRGERYRKRESRNVMQLFYYLLWD